MKLSHCRRCGKKIKGEKYNPHNETFGEYACFNNEKRFCLKCAEVFIQNMNRYKGGHWILHTETQYQSWKEKHIISQPKNNKEQDKIWASIINPMARRTFPSFFDISSVDKSANRRPDDN